MRKNAAFFSAVLILVAAFFWSGCSDDPTGPENLPPEKPSNPVPANLSGNIAANNALLQWECHDQDGDIVLYDIYLGTDPNPALVEAHRTQRNLRPGFLGPESVYYWRVVAIDEKGNISKSPIWSFRTCSARDFVYPLAIGNHWEYIHELWAENFIPCDSGIDYYFHYFANSIVYVDSLLSGQETDSVYFLGIGYTSETDNLEETKLYENRADGLYYCGNIGGDRGVLNTPAPVKHRYSYIFGGNKYDNLDDLLADFNPDWFGNPSLVEGSDEYPRRALAYPLQIGIQWIYTDMGEPFSISKKVAGWETVQVPAGSFDCYKVEWMHDINDDGIVDNNIKIIDYISAAGMIKRMALFFDVMVGTLEHPTGIGTADFIYKYELANYTIK